jgi:hypothetical protein
MAGAKAPRGIFFVGIAHDGTPGAAFRARSRALVAKPAYVVRVTFKRRIKIARTPKKPAPLGDRRYAANRPPPPAEPATITHPPRRRIICSGKDIPSSMETRAAQWKKST